MNNLKDIMLDGMTEAARLTRSGRLAEAKDVIQHTLKNALHNDDESTVSHGGSEESAKPINASYRIVEEDTSSTDTSRAGTVYRSAKPARPAEPVMDRSTVLPEIDLLGAGKITEKLQRLINRERKTKPEASPSSARARGKFIDGAFTNAAGTRTYKLYIPSAYTGQALPLVVMLHGCTQSSADFAAGTRMNILAERDAFFVVYPEQPQSANSSKCWNWFEPANQRRNAGEPSLIAGITQKIISAYHVNTDRIYIVGMSAGGAMSVIMAATYPDLYTAVGVHSGLAYGAAHDLPSGFAAMQNGASRHGRRLKRVIPLIMFHGDRDTTVAKVNADHIHEQWLQGTGNGGGPIGDAIIERGRVVGGHAYTRFIYFDKSGRTVLEEWIIHHAGHAWSGGSSSGSFTDAKGPDASAEMLRFFELEK
jgi:poly(hydroxyalkanoate) depolymerase family esterase